MEIHNPLQNPQSSLKPSSETRKAIGNTRILALAPSPPPPIRLILRRFVLERSTIQHIKNRVKREILIAMAIIDFDECIFCCSGQIIKQAKGCTLRNGFEWLRL